MWRQGQRGVAYVHSVAQDIAQREVQRWNIGCSGEDSLSCGEEREQLGSEGGQRREGEREKDGERGKREGEEEREGRRKGEKGTCRRKGGEREEKGRRKGGGREERKEKEGGREEEGRRKGGEHMVCNKNYPKLTRCLAQCHVKSQDVM